MFSTERAPASSAIDPGLDRLSGAYDAALSALLAEQAAEGYWTGELSASALSTATAVSALSMVRRSHPGHHDDLIEGGLAWLARHQNPDGGWGDTTKSHSNISTTMLGRAAFQLAGAVDRYEPCVRRAESWLDKHAGTTAPARAEAVRARYGKDRTFAVPILTTSALAGLVSWNEVASLPFELACLPQSWFRFLRLPVVSYALPALIAIGQAVHVHRPPPNPISRLIRRLAAGGSLRRLEAIQPSSGGFLEAVPLTAFVTLSLASIGHADHPVARRGVDFLTAAMLPDRSWAIDSNLSVWVTTQTVAALATAGELPALAKRSDLQAWLVSCQFQERHPYTGCAPGGWGWTHLPGSVPDADDTAGALLALRHLGAPVEHASQGLIWLLGLQNRDGGWPTFCRGWGHLPFDRSGPDLTAHALRAIASWQRPGLWPASIRPGCGQRALSRGFAYLEAAQCPDGSWLPLWFGNQDAADDANPTYGTARVLAAYRDLDRMNTAPARRGGAWLLAAQNADGGWGGGAGTPSSIEETALAVEILVDAGGIAHGAARRGLEWLIDRIAAGELQNAAPIGFYFAKLWYFEKLYPLIFTVAALGRAYRKLAPAGTTGDPPTNS